MRIHQFFSDLSIGKRCYLYLKSEDKSSSPLIDAFVKAIPNLELLKELLSPRGNRSLMISHNDPDGHTSSAVLRYMMCTGDDENDNRIYNIDYGYDFKELEMWIQKADIIYISDLSLENSQIATLCDLTKDLHTPIVWIDHHASSIDRVIPEKEKYRVFKFVIETVGISGCALCLIYSKLMDYMYYKMMKSGDWTIDWDTLKNADFWPDMIDCPAIVRNVSLYDTFDDSMSIKFQYGMKARDININSDNGKKFWNRSLGQYVNYTKRTRPDDNVPILLDIKNMMEELENQGGYIYNFMEWDFARMRKDMVQYFTFKIDGVDHSIAAMNGNHFSQMFGSVYTSVDGCIKYYQKSNGEYSYSIYSDVSHRDTCVNCQKIAEIFGGGGHPGSAGFSSKVNLVNKWRDDKVTVLHTKK